MSIEKHQLNLSEIKMLYKYRYFDCNNYHIKTILNNEFYFASKEELNDPFDLSLSPNFENYNLDELLNIVYNTLKNSENILQNLTKTFFENNLETDEDKRLFLVSKLKQSVTDSIAILGICSFSADNWNNILMWSHYCDSHKGFCLGLNFEKLNKHLQKLNTNENVKIHPFIVEYGQDLNKTFGDNIFERFLYALNYKYSIWDYEEEVRVINTNEKKTSLVLPEDIIEEVILGLYIADENKLLVMNALKYRTFKPKLYQIIQKDKSFEFERKEILY